MHAQHTGDGILSLFLFSDSCSETIWDFAPFMASIIVFISSFSGSGHANCTISLSRCHGVKEPHARLTVALICRSPSTYSDQYTALAMHA